MKKEVVQVFFIPNAAMALRLVAETSTARAVVAGAVRVPPEWVSHSHKDVTCAGRTVSAIGVVVDCYDSLSADRVVQEVIGRRLFNEYAPSIEEEGALPIWVNGSFAATNGGGRDCDARHDAQARAARAWSAAPARNKEVV